MIMVALTLFVEATRLFLKDLFGENGDAMSPELLPWERIKGYQEIANEAALRELGPLRPKGTGKLEKDKAAEN
jgi:hypothetical protein